MFALLGEGWGLIIRKVLGTGELFGQGLLFKGSLIKGLDSYQPFYFNHLSPSLPFNTAKALAPETITDGSRWLSVISRTPAFIPPGQAQKVACERCSTCTHLVESILLLPLHTLPRQFTEPFVSTKQPTVFEIPGSCLAPSPFLLLYLANHPPCTLTLPLPLFWPLPSLHICLSLSLSDGSLIVCQGLSLSCRSSSSVSRTL